MSKASLLPEEALLSIFRCFDDIRLPEDAECQWNTHWLAKCALVCKSWTYPARCSLYEKLYIPRASQITLLYGSLLFLRPENGKLVREFDPSEALREGETDRSVVRLVEVMPNLRALHLRLMDAKGLENTPCFRTLTSLSLDVKDHGEAEEEVVPEQVVPPNLESLSVSGSTLRLSQGLGPEAAYPNLRSLTFKCDYLRFTSHGRPRTPRDRLLPTMPSLTKLNLINCILEEQGDSCRALSLKIVSELSSSLKSLQLQGHYQGPRLDTSCLGGLSKLKILEIFCRPEFGAQNLQGIPPMAWKDIPPQIQNLTFLWEGPIDFGRAVLQRLQDPQFLPNLTTCPKIMFYNPYLAHSDEEIHELMAEVTHERDMAAQSLADRPNRLECWKPGYGDRPRRMYTLLPVTLPR